MPYPHPMFSTVHFLVISSLRVSEKESQVHISHFCTPVLCNTSRGFYIDVASGSVILRRHSRSSPAAHPATQLHVPDELILCPRCDQLSEIWRGVQIVRCFPIAVNGECRLTKGTTVSDYCKYNICGSCVECLPCR